MGPDQPSTIGIIYGKQHDIEILSKRVPWQLEPPGNLPPEADDLKDTCIVTIILENWARPIAETKPLTNQTWIQSGTSLSKFSLKCIAQASPLRVKLERSTHAKIANSFLLGQEIPVTDKCSQQKKVGKQIRRNLGARQFYSDLEYHL